ncbi:MAG: NFACT RNA binding domain-containing protein, partial [Bacteroidota bacterium]
VLPEIVGRTVAAVRTPERDRFLILGLDGGFALWVRLFGPRPNAILLRDGEPVDGFLGDDPEAPSTRPAPHPETPEAFAGRWRGNRKRLSQAVGVAVPLISAPLAADACRRAGLDPDAAPEADPSEGLWRGVESVLRDLETPAPHIAWRGEIPEALLPAPLAHPPEAWTVERMDSFDRACSVFARRSLASRRYRELYAPVEKPLARAAGKRQRSADAMLEELSQPSRADGYEAWGHLLMAQASGEGPGQEEIALPDILGDPSETVTIPLDPALSAVENAERYYDKARRTRRSREEAEGRWEAAHAEAEAMADLLARLRATSSLQDLRDLLDAEEDALGRFLRPEARGEASEPFHRFPLPGGYEALVGKHARGNAHLTTRVASPHDLWLHARGVPGSHVVIKKPGRSSVVPPEAVGQAARLAARFSTAKTQSQVPVQVTERKYVRPIKGGPPGLVRVDREEVLLVEPAVV